MATNLRNLFGTVVHDVPEGTSPVELRQFFSTVVHNIPVETSPVELRQFFSTVVHDVPEGTSPVELRQFFSTVVHDVVPIPGGIPCIQPEESDVQDYFGSGFVINNYLNLSGGRKRRVDQVPFKLGIRDKLGLRLDDTISTPPGDDPTDCD